MTVDSQWAFLADSWHLYVYWNAGVAYEKIFFRTFATPSGGVQISYVCTWIRTSRLRKWSYFRRDHTQTYTSYSSAEKLNSALRKAHDCIDQSGKIRKNASTVSLYSTITTTTTTHYDVYNTNTIENFLTKVIYVILQKWRLHSDGLVCSLKIHFIISLSTLTRWHPLKF